MNEHARAINNKPAKVIDKLSRLADRYPLDKYIWIMPRLDTAGVLPEHLDFMMKTRKFSVNEKDGDIYPLKNGGLALTKRSLMALASDAGVKWIPNLNQRVDDGSDPDVVEWKATGILAGLSGMTPVSATKRLDLAHVREMEDWKLRNRPPREIWYKGQKVVWSMVLPADQESYIQQSVTENDLKRKEFKVENAETKAQLRVIRAILAIPSRFEPSVIANKEFAVLQVIFAPNAQTPEERKMIIGQMMQTYLGAYPGAEQAASLQPGKEESSIVVGGPDPRPQLVEGQGIPPTIEQPLYTDAELVDDDNEERQSEEEKKEEPKTTDNFEFLKAIGSLKKEFEELLGKEEGQVEYYKPIYDLNVKHSNQIVDGENQKQIYRTLKARLELIKQNIQKEDPDEWLFKPIRAELVKQTKEKLAESIQKYRLDYEYDIDEDPKGIKEFLSGDPKKEDLIEAHIRILKDKKERDVEGRRA